MRSNNNVKHYDFIGEYDDFFPKNFCQHLINEFDRLEKIDFSFRRYESIDNCARIIKDDAQIFLNHHNDTFNNLRDFDGNNTMKLFFDCFWEAYKHYGNFYSTSYSFPNVFCDSLKLQKTKPEEGYHVWHCEYNPVNKSRLLAFILYLNTFVQGEGGETEFLFQRKRVIPTENKLLIWPSSFTHMHRGNPPLVEKNKYIATGWIHIPDNI